MTNTDETQEAPGSVLLASPLHFKKQGEWNYHLRQLKRPQRQGRGSAAQKVGWHGRHSPAGGQRGAHRRGGEPRGAGGVHSGRNKEGFLGPVSAGSDFGRTQAGFLGPASADSDFQQRTLPDLSWALAVH